MLRALCLSIQPNGAAERAGLLPQDVLISYNGHLVESPEQLASLTQATFRQSEKVPLHIARDGEVLDLHMAPGPLGGSVIQLDLEGSGEREIRRLRIGVVSGLQPSRLDIRALAEWASAQMTEAVSAGRNVYQVGLDQQDQIESLGKNLPDPDEFHRIYTEELCACTNRALDEIAAKEQQTATGVVNFSVLMSWAGLILFAFFMFTVIRR